MSCSILQNWASQKMCENKYVYILLSCWFRKVRNFCENEFNHFTNVHTCMVTGQGWRPNRYRLATEKVNITKKFAHSYWLIKGINWKLRSGWTLLWRWTSHCEIIRFLSMSPLVRYTSMFIGLIHCKLLASRCVTLDGLVTIGAKWTTMGTHE
jgi:hypothetical protein